MKPQCVSSINLFHTEVARKQSKKALSLSRGGTTCPRTCPDDIQEHAGSLRLDLRDTDAKSEEPLPEEFEGRKPGFVWSN